MALVSRHTQNIRSVLGVILLFSDLQNNLQLLEEDQFALTLEASGIEDKHAILIESKWLLFVCLSW